MSETAQRPTHPQRRHTWAQAVAEDGTFKSVDELKALYGSKASLETKMKSWFTAVLRAFITFLVRAQHIPQERKELRRLMDRVGQPDRQPD
jgi:hypothetical protein